ncbi:MAG: gephyrin-like molybdotransferase Glp [Chloroflexota bacterium]
MISVEEAREKILGQVDVLEAEETAILDTVGQVLAEDVTSGINIPPLDNSAMDGYAVRAGDTEDATEKSPSILRVIDTVIAGTISQKTVTPGTAVRIMTGAPVPAGADAVVRFEDTDEKERRAASGGALSEIGVLQPVPAGKDIRRSGEDVARGTTVLMRGTVIRPAEVGVLASLGQSRVKVVRRPLVAVLATGDELTELDDPLPPGRIYNSNTYSAAALVKRYGGIPKILGIARDREESLVEKLHQGLDADMLITTGGVSLGDYDIVKDILAKEGEIGFWTVRMKPGKPIAFGTFASRRHPGKRLPHLGLPGNPVSTMVTFELFARPAILKMMGKTQLAKPEINVILEEDAPNEDGRRQYHRAIVEKRNGRYYARLTGAQGSGILTSMSRANALVIVPEDTPGATRGATVPALMLDWNEEM